MKQTAHEQRNPATDANSSAAIPSREPGIPPAPKLVDRTYAERLSPR